MPKVYLSAEDRMMDAEARKLRAELLAAGFRNADLAEWLGCSPQNIGYLWKNKSFSWRQILIVQAHLRRYEERGDL